MPRVLTRSPPSSPTASHTTPHTKHPPPSPSLMPNASHGDPASQYTILEKLGTGSFGTVYKGMHNDTKQIVAIKQIDLEDSDDDISEIQQEIAHLAQCDSEYVTKYFGAFVTGYKLWIVMEYLAGGSCLDLLKPGVFAEAHIAVVCRELLLALAYLHGEGMVHRDIKAANVLLAASGRVKLADFGVAATLGATLRHTFVGTPFWMAPEVIRQAGYDARADIWSMGITAIELAKGEPPLAEYHPMRVLFLIPKAKPPQLDGAFSPAFKDFVAQCLVKDPKLRPSAKDLLQHRFIKGARRTSALTELIERYQDYSARNRKPSAAAVPNINLAANAAAINGMGVADLKHATLNRTWGRADGDTIRSEWLFETIRSNAGGGGGKGSVMGSYRSLAHAFAAQQGLDTRLPPGMVADEDYEESVYEEEALGLAAIEESEDSYDTGGATKGSEDDLPNGIGVNNAAAHSTVVIRRPSRGAGNTFGAHAHDRSDTDSASEEEDVADDADALGAPPAYDTPAAPNGAAAAANGTTQPQPQPQSQSPPPSPTSPNSLGRRASYMERTAPRGGRGTALRAADLGNGVDTIRPVKRVDAAGSLRRSAEYVGALRDVVNGTQGSAVSASSGGNGMDGKDGKDGKHRRRESEDVKAGRAMLDEVVLPVVQNAIQDGMDAREIEALSMLQRGFEDLRASAPQLAYSLLCDVMQGIDGSAALRAHVHAQRSTLFAHRRVVRAAEMTARGLVVTEREEEFVPGLPNGSGNGNGAGLEAINVAPAGGGRDAKDADEPARKSPIAELLYMRWLEGLKLKWPNIL